LKNELFLYIRFKDWIKDNIKNCIPESVKKIKLGNDFNQEIVEILPKTIKKIKIPILYKPIHKQLSLKFPNTEIYFYKIQEE
ncbi:MAG: FNIP repeat-containing protein, partial [Candidatus Pacearchaeota archaeon]